MSTPVDSGSEWAVDSAIESAILATAAHELKNALSGISVALMRCEQRLASGDAVTKDDLATARAEVRRLARLTNDLLDGARVDLGTLAIRPAAFDAAALVREVAATFQASSGRTVQVDAPASPVSIVADAERLRGVLLNFLENAAKYAPDREAIEVSLTATGTGTASGTGVASPTEPPPPPSPSRVRFAVRDHGPGLAAADQARVFERFTRTAEAESGSARGLGLGLFLCRSIARAHGGEVGVDSAPGAGATFWCEVPSAELGALTVSS